jgi:hypothetical protein
MSIRIDGSKAQVHWLSNEHNNGLLTKNHGILYVNDKLGQVTKDAVDGLLPKEAFESRYSGQKSSLKEDLLADDIIVFNKHNGVDFDYDDGVRRLIHELYVKGKIPFDALHPDYQLPNQNSEALIGYLREEHLDILIDVVKQYYGLGQYFDTKDPVEWRWGQESEVEGIVERLRQHHLCLYAAYTGRGKTKISMEVATRLCEHGGIVLVTTPITETKESFKQNIRDCHFGFDRSLQITCMESAEFARHNVADITVRAQAGELIIIVLTVQDARYADCTVDDVAELREKYSALSGHIDLWIRDERHFQYSGEITSQRLANMHAAHELDLTATPYNVLDKYNFEHILARTLVWGLKNREYTGLPFIRIDAINTPVSAVSSSIANIFDEEEGYDPRKLVIRSNKQFVLEAEWKSLTDLMYHSPLSKKKNSLSIVNDVELSTVAKNCGMWVLPAGQDGDGASDYIPALAEILNLSSQGQTYFTDSYTVERTCPKGITIGEYITDLMIKHGRVIILTCGKFLTGTDIPPLGHIVLFDKMNNIADFEQLIGRLTRNYPGKTEVKLYTLMPGSSVSVLLGRQAKATSMLGGGTEWEYLDCIPLSQYNTSEGSFVRLDPEQILQNVQEWFQDQVRHKLPSYSLQSAISEIDMSFWNSINTSIFKKINPTTALNNETGARVKDKISTDPKTGQPRTKQELNKIEQIEKAIQAITTEVAWIAYSIDNYDFEVVYHSPILVKIFGQELVDATFDAIQQSKEIEQIIRKNLLDKQQAYANLSAEEVYSEIFKNSDFKQKAGLVYVDFDLAKILVNKMPESKYNNEDETLLVVNALNGSIPLTLKKKFPNAKIVCAEYFPYFEDHLTRLGFEVIEIYVGDDNAVHLKEGNNMKLKPDAILGNPPFQAPKKGDYSFWARFVDKSHKLLNDDGYLSMIIPAGWMSPTNDIRQGQRSVMRDIFAKENTSYINVDPNLGKDHFPGVGQTFTWFQMEKGSYQETELDLGNNKKITVDLTSVPFLPKSSDEHAINVIKKISSGQPKWNFTRYIMTETWDDLVFDKSISHTWARINGNGNHLDKVAYSKNPCKFQNKRKVVLPYNGTFYQFVVDNGVEGCTNAYVMLLDDRDLYDSAHMYFNSTLVKWIGKNKFTQYNEGALINSITAMDLSKPITEDDIYKFYNISEEERNYIKNVAQ